MKLRNIIILILFYVGTVYSQQKKDTTSLKYDYNIIEGDTLMINLSEVQILGKLKFKTNYDKKYYYWYRKKTIKAYPYAKLAAERLQILNERLSKIKSKRKQKKYIKIIHKYLEKEFKGKLKKLTRTEGRILLKLIHRQTGETAYQLVKTLRSGWKAFWYNSTAYIFNLSLKYTYDPVHNMEDYMIEDILQRAFSNGVLNEQNPKNKIDYFNSDFKEIDVYKFLKKK